VQKFRAAPCTSYTQGAAVFYYLIDSIRPCSLYLVSSSDFQGHGSGVFKNSLTIDRRRDGK
jgi:hypothetical protein